MVEAERKIERESGKRIILVSAYRGSISHNLYIPSKDRLGTDDVGIVEVYAFPEKYYLDLGAYQRTNEHFVIMEGQYDKVSH